LQQMLVIPTSQKHIGWPAASLAEVSSAPVQSPLPESYPHLAGTTFHRGRILTLLDFCSLAGLPPHPEGNSLAVRFAAPSDHLAALIPGVEAVIDYSPLELREEAAQGVWAGLYPWGETWLSVVDPAAVVRALSSAMAEYLHSHSTGRSHAP
jgi:chemotaxis signal transduction protein